MEQIYIMQLLEAPECMNDNVNVYLSGIGWPNKSPFPIAVTFTYRPELAMQYTDDDLAFDFGLRYDDSFDQVTTLHVGSKTYDLIARKVVGGEP